MGRSTSPNASASAATAISLGPPVSSIRAFPTDADLQALTEELCGHLEAGEVFSVTAAAMRSCASPLDQLIIAQQHPKTRSTSTTAATTETTCCSSAWPRMTAAATSLSE